MKPSATKLTTKQKQEIRTRRHAGEKLRSLAIEYSVHWRLILDLCRDIEPLKAITSRICSCLRRNPEESNEVIAEKCGTTPEYVQQRRDFRAGREQKTHEDSWTDEDRVLTGRKLSDNWLRHYCSRRERDLRQIQALCPFGLTLADISRSAKLAGLTVEDDGFVCDPNISPRASVPANQSPPRVYKIGATGIRRIK